MFPDKSVKTEISYIGRTLLIRSFLFTFQPQSRIRTGVKNKINPYPANVENRVSS